jgi:hypothetical protein
MSNDEFGTQNVSSQQMARELESLRQRYLAHRDTLSRLEADAPSEQLAVRYAELRHELEMALQKVDELGSGRGTLPGTRAAVSGAAAAPRTVTATPAPTRGADWQNRSVLSDVTAETQPVPPEAVGSDATRRILLIGAVALLVLTLLGALAWRYSKNRAASKAVIVEQTSSDVTTTQPSTVVETTATESAAAESDLTVTPEAHDFGVIKKGTRAVRQFRIENHTSRPMTVTIKRSACRCLWFDYDSKVPAKSSTILAVTVDGAKAKAGALKESIELSAGSERATVAIRALIE